jgi:hypothetical protein
MAISLCPAVWGGGCITLNAQNGNYNWNIIKIHLGTAVKRKLMMIVIWICGILVQVFNKTALSQLTCLTNSKVKLKLSTTAIQAPEGRGSIAPTYS